MLLVVQQRMTKNERSLKVSLPVQLIYSRKGKCCYLFFLFEKNWSWILLTYLSSADLKSNFITPLKDYSTIGLVPCMLNHISKLFVTACDKLSTGKISNSEELEKVC